jgi:hypothetical protein
MTCIFWLFLILKIYYMKIPLLITFITSFSLVSIPPIFGQVKKNQISLGANYARHGSGDMDGILINLDYNRNFTKKFSVIYNLGFSLHGQKAFPGVIENTSSIPPDQRTAVPQWVTAGIQVAGLLKYNFRENKSTGLHLSAGPLLRYQLNSYPNGYNYYGSGNAWFRQPFYVFREIDNNRLNLGYAIRVGYDFKANSNRNLGLHAFLQNDTNADLLVGFGLKIRFVL